ncbi:MAG: hypothetical protein M5T52_20570 [Ignavibacteriaceae bacterium]|nr:hypothetical protein [Ignavibacteriaceae bacterium]
MIIDNFSSFMFIKYSTLQLEQTFWQMLIDIYKNDFPLSAEEDIPGLLPTRQYFNCLRLAFHFSLNVIKEILLTSVLPKSTNFALSLSAI